MQRVYSSVLFVVLALLLSGAAAAIGAAQAEAVANQQAPLGNLLLQSAGRTTSISSLTWNGSAFTRTKVWPGARVALDTRQALFTVADFTGDGLPDGAALRPRGTRGALIDLFVSDGSALRRSVAWKSDRAGFKVASVKLASGDIDDDGFAELLVLAPYGRTGAQILSFSFGADGVGRRSVYRSRRAGFAVAGAQFTCADLNGDGKDDAILLGRSGERTVLQGLRSDGGRLSRRYTWRGALPAGSRLAAGHTLGKGSAEALVLRPLSAGRAAVERFTVRATGFAKTRVWSGRIAASGASLSCADVDGDGRSDLLALAPRSPRGSVVRVLLSRGDRFVVRVAWSGTMATSGLRLASGASLPVILSDESEILTENESALLLSVVEVPPPDPVPDGYVQEYIDTFSGAGPEGIAVGDVLVLAGCPAAPDGLLHKVLAIEPLGATTVMRTEQASLEDAVQSVDLNYGQPIEEDDLEEATFLREGVKLVKARGAAKKLGFDLAWQIDCEHDGLRASGRLELSQKFDVNVKISWFKLQSARFVSTTSESTELKLTKTGAWGAEKEWVIARYPLSKVTVWVGALPVVIKPELQIFVGASGQVEAGITTGVHQKASVTIGADYVRGRAGSDFKDLSTASFDSGFDPPTLHAAAELKGYAGIKLATAVYGVAGPYAALQGFGRLTADINEDPWWTLDVGLEAQVGFEMKALKFKYGWTFTLFEYEIAHAEDPAPEKPAIAVDAVTNGTDPPYIAVGGPVTWTYRVTNPGSVPLSSVTVDDDMLASADDPAYESGDANADGKLDRTETWVFEAGGVAVAGAYASTGTAHGTSPAGTVVSAADGSSYFGSAPGIHVDTVTNGSDGSALPAGDPITWTSTVTNTGNVPLSAVSVDDDQLAPSADPVYMSGDTNANARLDLAEQWIFSASGIAVAGTHSNTVTASGTGPANDAVSDADDSSYVGSASVSVEEFVIADDGLEDSSPAISGATVVWGNGGSGQLDVWGCDLGATPIAPYPIWQSAFFKRGFAISGDTIVWSDARNSYLESTPFGYSDIYGYKLGALGGELEICRYAGEQLHPDIDGDFVVWSDNRSGAWEIYGLDLPVGSGEPFVIATGVGTSSDWVEPAVAGDVVVWGQTGGIFGWRRGGSVFPITTATSSAPAISGDIVVWSEYRDVGMDIYGYDLAEGAEFAVCTAAGSQTDPDIDGDRVVWTDDRSGAWDIYGCSLTTMATFPICTAQGEQYEPAVSGNVVVWSDTRSGIGYPDIWGARLTP